MLNQVIVVGRLTKINKNDDENIDVTIAVPRSFKNENGEYETDFIKCNLNKMLAINVLEYCEKGDLISIKGNIRLINNKLNIIADKVCFLSKKGDTNE